MTGNQSAPAALDRSQAPLSEVAKRFELAPFERQRIGQLEILCLPRRGFPIVSMSLIATSAGAEQQPLDRAGLATLTAGCLTEGTSESTAVEFQSRAERLGGFVSSGADWEATALHAGSLSEHFGSTLKLVASAYQDAAFRPEDINRLLDRRASELARRAEEPAAMAGTAFIRELYGDNSHYATPLIGTDTSLEGISDEEIARYWHGRRSGAALVVAGDVTMNEVERLAGDYLSPLLGGEAAPEGDPLPTATAKRNGIKVIIIDRPKAAQSQLLMGHVGPSRLHPQRPTLRLLNSIFGGKFSSRVNLNLRERHGYTYGANSSFAARRGPGPFAVQAAVENEFAGKAAEQVLLELERIRSELVDSRELEDTRSYLLGVQPYGFQSLEGWVSALGTLAVFDLPDDWYAKQQEALIQLSAEDVHQAARTHLDPNNLVITAVGPARALEAQFSTFDTVEVRDPAAR